MTHTIPNLHSFNIKVSESHNFGILATPHFQLHPTNATGHNMSGLFNGNATSTDLKTESAKIATTPSVRN